MAVTVELQNTGRAELRQDLVAMIEHVFSDRPGNWRVVIIGSQENDRWEMKLTGPSSFERSYALEGVVGEHDPRAVATIIARMLPKRT